MNSITFCDLSEEWFDYNENDIFITKSKIEYFIHIKGSTYAIRWHNPIAVSELKKIIFHKWVCLDERKSSDFCGNCDGWDYSGCDMDRCREECEGCGGRRYKCNNRCFFLETRLV